ncbi:hypothetical protein AB205_0053290 [Aquarana catesbeiana]|uniref:Uncharacterized protein n=1 Tax=Aquarana catesbeiana TaxID=8400 RepID=A0A2G9NH79_AQUCT|nr:hypothetical protein AB205_0053290 [Aquarana catesbeiana]
MFLYILKKTKTQDKKKDMKQPKIVLVLTRKKKKKKQNYLHVIYFILFNTALCRPTIPEHQSAWSLQRRKRAAVERAGAAQADASSVVLASVPGGMIPSSLCLEPF